MRAAQLSTAAKLLTSHQLDQQLKREYLKTQIKEIDSSLEGFPRGAITEISGGPSSGRTSLTHAFLASATVAGEHCALVDGCDSFDPETAAACGADLDRLLWVRCGGNIESALKSVDLLIHSGGWGAIILDFAGFPSRLVRKLPISYWYRFRRAVENTPTALVVMEHEPFVRACAALALEFNTEEGIWTGSQPDFQLLQGARIRITPRKPAKQQVAFEPRSLLA